ncbi:MAG: hypothetical protein ABW153_11920 [Sedimenticola sp.]
MFGPNLAFATISYRQLSFRFMTSLPKWKVEEKMKNIFAFIALLTLSATTQAGLILHISPDGTGGTRWQFEGSTTVLSSGGNNSFWGENSGTLSNTYNASHSITSGSGTLSSTSGGTASVINVWASEHTYDGVSPRVSYITWGAGDVLSWFGDLTSTLPFSGLNLGTVVADNIGFYHDISEPLTITVSRTALGEELPVPAPLALLGLGLIALSYSRRKA